MKTAIPSPCTKVCTMDPRHRVCAGCGRTLEEIAAWGTMSESERQHIMAALPARRREIRDEETRRVDNPPAGASRKT